LLRYLDARTCRHDFVLRYFGDEKELLGGCGHCDVCRELDEEQVGDEVATGETTLTVKKALSAVARAQRRGGLQAVAEMLRGIENDKTSRFGFTKLSTFGLFRERSHDWTLALLRALLAAGWIDLTPTEHPVPYLTLAGAAVMKGEAPARIVLPSERRAPASKRRTRGERASLPALDGDTQALFERLRARRAEIAKQSGMPAYVVAHDRTLADMAHKRPLTREALLCVHGMGPARVEQYGERFLDVLVDR
ncbi:MAG TPA: HRDC domain-containing protein, partial [Labilithrix sp.]|nr:HRDC domain-containing protein [Labilithrix sp.]